MKYAGLLLLMLAVVDAAEGASTAALLRWPGGPADVRTAVAWLAASGNETRLDSAVQERSATPDFVTGTYWQAVLAVCEAYGLGISSQSGTTGRYGPEDQPERLVTVEWGPLLLVPAMPDGEAQPALMARLQVAEGPLLLSVADAGIVAPVGAAVGELQVRFRLRLEPCLSGGTPLEHALLRVHRLSAGEHAVVAGWSVPVGPWDGAVLGLATSGRSPDSEGWNRLRAPGVPSDAAGCVLQGTLLVQGSRTTRAQTVVAVPGAGVLDFAGESLPVELAPGADGQSVELVLQLPPALAGEMPTVHVRNDRGRRRPVQFHGDNIDVVGNRILRGRAALPPAPMTVEAARAERQPIPVLPWRLAIALP